MNYMEFWDLWNANNKPSKTVIKEVKVPKVKEVIFNPPATIVLWTDKTKTVVKCSEGDTFDQEKGLALCFVKKIHGNERDYYKKYIKPHVNDKDIFNFDNPFVCPVCGMRIDLPKNAHYIAREDSNPGNFLGEVKLFDAVDCPICGCQKILQTRKRNWEGGKNGK